MPLESVDDKVLLLFEEWIQTALESSRRLRPREQEMRCGTVTCTKLIIELVPCTPLLLNHGREQKALNRS